MPEGSQPATKQDLADLEGRLRDTIDSSIRGSETRLQKQIAGSETRLQKQIADRETRLGDAMRETVRDSETRLLKAFYGIAESTQKRLALHDQTDGSLLGRLETLESRLLEVEKRLNTPPGA